MNIKPIKTDSDYRAALAQIEALWDSKSGTRQAEELEVLATLVEVYEQEHEEIPPPDPIDAILFRLEQEGKTRRELQNVLGIWSRASIGDSESEAGSFP